MALVSLNGVSIAFGGPLLLDKISFSVETGERICLIGRNGSGKSTIIKLINREIKPDCGEILFQQGVAISLLSQDVPEDISGTVFEVISNAFGLRGRLLARYHQVSNKLTLDHSEKTMAEFEKVQHELESLGGWEMHQKVEAAISRLQISGDTEFSKLSGGYKRRVLLAGAIACEPDLLLLDEPTNHLDIDTITWVEDFLLSFKGTLLFVTHDRMLLKKLATRIIDLDRGRITTFPGDYNSYLENKYALLNNEATENAKFDKRLAEEEVWIRQGVKARRTRNEGRVRALIELRRIRSERKNVIGTSRMQIQEVEKSGRLVIEAKDICYRYQDTDIIHNFTTTIMRGDKVGIIGKNGSGKTTLLRLLLGDLKPQEGHLKIGTNLKISYMDQHRAQLDGERSVQDNLADGNDYVTINGRERHVIGYLQDFLFTPMRARTPVKVLSGGEKNRLLLAKLFAAPSNIIVFDEPTNDLDLETLDLLEELLVEFSGTVLLVSHDREFINNIATNTLVFEGNGRINEYVGGYDDWLRQKKNYIPASLKKSDASEKDISSDGTKKNKLPFKEQKELKGIPELIERLESEKEELLKSMADPAFYRQDKLEVSKVTEALTCIEKKLKDLYARWEALEALKTAS